MGGEPIVLARIYTSSYVIVCQEANTYMNRDSKRDLEACRRESIRIAKQLCYDKECIKAITEAKTTFDMNKALISARTRMQNAEL